MERALPHVQALHRHCEGFQAENSASTRRRELRRRSVEPGAATISSEARKYSTAASAMRVESSAAASAR
jgi:hypothetical protein